jgi:diaminopimelate decarboxylase
MKPFARIDGQLHCEGVALEALAQRFGTPCYVYSGAALDAAYRAYDDALAGHAHQVCYAVKANPSLAILNRFARLGAGFDIVSGGELARVLAAGGDPARWCFPAWARAKRKCTQRLKPASTASTSNRKAS